jgi:heptosyltransferase-3
MKISTNVQKILVIATHCIGDSLLSTCLTRSLRNAYPQAEIDVLVTDRGRMVFNGNTDISNLISIPLKPKPKDYLRLIKHYFRAYDVVVNDRQTDRTAIYSWVFGKRRLGIVDLQEKSAWFKKWVYTDYVFEQGNYEHRLSRNLRILEPLDIPKKAIVVSPEAELPTHIIEKLPKQYIVVHTPSSNEIKQWPVEYWQQSITQLLNLGYRIVLTGANSDRDRQIVAQISKTLDGDWINVAGELSLAQTSTLIKHSMGFVGPDSGPGHMASGYPIPIVSIISVAPASMWSPWPYDLPVNETENIYKNRIPVKQIINNVAVLQSERSCVPCYKNKCQISDDFYSPCLQDISAQRLVDAVQELIPLR